MAAKKMSKQNQEFKLLDERSLSEVTGLSKGFIRKARFSYGLPYYKVGSLVRFNLSEVMLWIAQRKVV